MNRADFYKRYSEENRLPMTKTKQICDSVFSLLARSILDEERVYIIGLGTFKKKIRKARQVWDINTGKVMDLPDIEKIVFKLSDNLEDRLAAEEKENY